MPMGGIFKLAAIDMFILLATFEFGRMYIHVSNEMRRNDPLGGVKIKEGIIGERWRRYDLGNSGSDLFGHGGVARKSFVREVLKTDDGQNVWQKLELKKSVVMQCYYVLHY
jgi:hypothetical protein